jgi:hypothetical protein
MDMGHHTTIGNHQWLLTHVYEKYMVISDSLCHVRCWFAIGETLIASYKFNRKVGHISAQSASHPGAMAFYSTRYKCHNSSHKDNYNQSMTQRGSFCISHGPLSGSSQKPPTQSEIYLVKCNVILMCRVHGPGFKFEQIGTNRRARSRQ